MVFGYFYYDILGLEMWPVQSIMANNAFLNDTVDAPLVVVMLNVVSEISCDGIDSSKYHPDPANCVGFYLCLFNKPVKFSCPPGTMWDDQLQTCNWPYALPEHRRQQCHGGGGGGGGGREAGH